MTSSGGKVDKLNIPSLKMSNGQEIPVLGIGTSRTASQTEDLFQALKYAFQIGYRHVDTAWIYFIDSVLNRAVKDAVESGVCTREEMFLVCKPWNTHHSKNNLVHACQDTLKNIGSNFIDLYVMHWPFGFKENLGAEPYPRDNDGKLLFSDVSYLETWRAMEDLCKQGTLKSIGVCNFNRKQLEDILNNCSVKPVVNQIEVHPYCQNDRLIEFCQNNGITVVAYSPLGAADLAESKDMPILLEDPVLIEIAKKHNKTPAQICIKWCLQRGLVVIPKALDEKCILENGLVFDFTLSDDDMCQIKKLNKNLRYFSAPECKDHPLYPFKDEE